MPLSDVMGKAGAQDPGPKKGRGALTWEQMRLWNKYYDNNSGKSLEEIYGMMSKENPDAVKGLTFEKLQGAFDEQSARAYDKEMKDFQNKKASGYWNSKEGQEKKEQGIDENWEPQYRSINKFLPAQYMPAQGDPVDLGLTNEYGEFENPKGFKIKGGGPIKQEVAKKIPSDITLKDVEVSSDYDGWVSWLDPREGRTFYVPEDEAEKTFGEEWFNKRKTQKEQAASEWDKKKSEILAKKAQKKG